LLSREKAFLRVEGHKYRLGIVPEDLCTPQCKTVYNSPCTGEEPVSGKHSHKSGTIFKCKKGKK
jgi:hypothetical protein